MNCLKSLQKTPPVFLYFSEIACFKCLSSYPRKMSSFLSILICRLVPSSCNVSRLILVISPTIVPIFCEMWAKEFLCCSLRVVWNGSGCWIVISFLFRYLIFSVWLPVSGSVHLVIRVPRHGAPLGISLWFYIEVFVVDWVLS